MRVVNTRVLPEPAPASTSQGPEGAVTAASCSGLRPASKGEWPGAKAEPEWEVSIGNEFIEKL